MNKIKEYLRNLFSGQSYGLMVVNCNYYRPMANGKNNFTHKYLSDDKYLEICDQIKNA